MSNDELLAQANRATEIAGDARYDLQPIARAYMGDLAAAVRALLERLATAERERDECKASKGTWATDEVTRLRRAIGHWESRADRAFAKAESTSRQLAEAQAREQALVAALPPADKLLLLADWFDVDDAKKGKTGHEVQDDLRDWAVRILAALEAPSRPHRLTWDGNAWIAPCGCAYHSEDDNGTHQGAPHIHRCAQHAPAPSQEPGAQEVANHDQQ